MNYNDPIKFQQERDFGQVFNATFVFLKQERKKLWTVFLKYCGPLLILTLIAFGLYQSRILNLGFNTSDITQYDDLSMLASVAGVAILALLLLLATYSMICTSVYAYISLYVEKGSEGFEIEDVWQKIGQNYFRILGVSLLKGLIIVIGFIFCILPGIYLSISLSMIFIIMIYEKKPFGDSFSRSFEITHERWWWTLLLLFIFNIVISLIRMVFQLPATIISMVYMVNSIESGDISSSISIVYGVLNSLSIIIGLILYTIPYIAISFQYFAIVETKEKPSLMDQIDHIG